MAKKFRVPKKTLRVMMDKITDAARREYEQSLRLGH